MKEQKKYSQSEIDTNINTLENEIEGLKLHRTELSQSINSKKKQILSWKELDLSQLKMF